MEGRQVIERASARHRRTHILVVARCLDHHNYLEAMDLGAVDHLKRPEPEDVGWVLETQLRRHSNIVVKSQAV